MAKAHLSSKTSNELHLTLVTVPVGTVLHRVHLSKYGATRFNPTGAGNARFSPIRDATGQVIPTLYTGSTYECAAMETVFHDVPYAPGFKTYPKGRLAGHEHSTISTATEICVIDLTAKSLRLLGIERRNLIDTEVEGYVFSRELAEALHKFAPEAQGLRWVSRQDDTAMAMVLFGDRIEAASFVQQGASRDLIANEAAYGELMDLANHIGVLLVSD